MIGFSIVLAIVLIYYTLRDLDWSAFWNALREGHYKFLLLTIPLSSLNYYVRAIRWRTCIQTQQKVSVLSVFWANMIGYMGNAYLPARAGELLRSSFLGKKTGLGVSYILATALGERLLDVVALVLVFSIALLSQRAISDELTPAVSIMALVGFIGLVLFIVVPYQERNISRLFNRISFPDRISRFMSEQFTRFITGMRSFQSAKRLFLFLFLTVIIWLVDAFGCTIGVRIVSQSVTIGQALVLLAGLGLSSALPATPGYIGVYQFVAVLVLVPFGFSRADALAYILISQFAGYLVVSLWGLIGLWQINK